MEATSGGGIGVRCAQAASILTSINEKLQAAHVADVDKGTLIADVAMLKAFTAAGASLDEISPVLGAINEIYQTYVEYTDAPPSAFFEALTELSPDAWIAKVKESIDARLAELATKSRRAGGRSARTSPPSTA